VLKADKSARRARPTLNVFGGKITTYRRLAESVLEKIETMLGCFARGCGCRTGACNPQSLAA
jgi:glycerol-3-phosphate dehydrogenase